MNRILGVLNAIPEKRYKNFISTVVDREKVWLLDDGEGYATFEQEDEMYLLVWQERKMAEMFASKSEQAVYIEIHEFCRLCESNIDNRKLKFIVCPNEKDSCIATVEGLLSDITRELNRIE